MKQSSYREVSEKLQALKLNGILAELDETTERAESETLSHLDYLKELLSLEVSSRKDRRLKRNFAAAHFPNVKRIEDFRTKDVKGFNAADVASLKDLRWLDNFENILFFGPPGIGKTHLAISCGILAVEAGYTVCFERIVNLFRLLKTAEIHRKSNFRIQRIMKADLVIFDEIGYTPIEKREANLFFNLISEIFEKSSIIITSNKSFNDWAEMMGDEIMTTALLDRLLHNAKVFNMDGKSGR